MATMKQCENCARSGICPDEALHRGVSRWACPYWMSTRTDMTLVPAPKATVMFPVVRQKCVKCLCEDIRVRWNGDGYHAFPLTPAQKLHHRKDEHLDYKCRDCHFEWEGDCADAPKQGGDDRKTVEPKSDV